MIQIEEVAKNNHFENFIEKIDVEVTCNCCGERFQINNYTAVGMENQGRISLKKTYFGYGSIVDGLELEYFLCDKCELSIVEKFKIEPEKRDVLFPLTDEECEEMNRMYAEAKN